MESQKPRRKTKWLSKLLHRDDSSSSPQVSRKTNPAHQVATSNFSTHERKPSSSSTLTKSPSEERNSSPPQLNEATAVTVEATQSNPQVRQPQSAASQLLVIEQPQRERSPPPPAYEKNASLSSPPIPKEKGLDDYRKSTSPYRNDKENGKTPPLLDTRVFMKNAGLWEKAYAQLSGKEDYKALFEKYEAVLEDSALEHPTGTSFSTQMNAFVENKLNVMKQKQWILQWDQKSIVIRDQAERIVKFVQTFSSIGTAAAQIDPVHVGIPWAGVCAVLNLIMSDSTQHHAALDGLEEVTSIVAKYIAIEDVFVESARIGSDPTSVVAFEGSIIVVYSSVLLFQVKAALHFHRQTMARTVSNLVKSVDWTNLLAKVRQNDADCVALTTVTGMTNVTSGIGEINNTLTELDRKWNDMKNINNVLEKLQNELEKTQRTNGEIISWISNIQVGEDHERVRAKLGARYWNAGHWLLLNSAFKIWKASPRGQFWLQGSVGTGKTSLASIVINDLVKRGKNLNIAFFYCSRGLVTSFNNPTTIFRSLVAQLSSTVDGEGVHHTIKERHYRYAKKYVTGSRLTLTECEELLVTLMKDRGKTIILVDGIDECSEPMSLLRALHRIWKAYPGLKLFITSRLDVDVPEVFSRITTIRSDLSKTSEDIEEYIRGELKRKERRNSKVITEELADRMVKILMERAQGMFRWVELQLDLLISPERPIRYRRDFEARLVKLEAGSGTEVLASLRETYDDIYNRNIQDGENSKRVVEKALQWVLCSARPLKIWELAAAVSVTGEDAVSTTLVTELCSNFFIVDPVSELIQLAHLSVREYLEVKSVDGRLIYSPAEAHAEAAVTCFVYWEKAHRKALCEDDGVYEVSDNPIPSSDDEESISEPAEEDNGRESGPDKDAPGETERELAETPSEYQTSKSQFRKGVTWGPIDPQRGWPLTEVTQDVDLDEDLEQEAADKVYRENVMASKVSSETGKEEEIDAEEIIRAVTPPGMETNRTKSSFDAPNADFKFDYEIDDGGRGLLKEHAPASKPRSPFKRFENYASLYWATHYQAVKGVKNFDFQPLKGRLLDFLDGKGGNPAFKEWSICLLTHMNIQQSTTGFQSSIVDPDAERPRPLLVITRPEVEDSDSEEGSVGPKPVYQKWKDTMTYTGNKTNPVMPSVALIGCVYGFTEIFEDFWADGEAQTTENRDGLLGLVLAAKNGRNEIFDLPVDLLTYSDLDLPTKDGKTTLHHAAIGGYEELARFLLGYPRDKRKKYDSNGRQRRTHVNSRDMLERTPLHYAAEFRRLEIIKLLLAEDDLDIHARDHFGKITALRLCSRYPEAAKLLRNDRRYDPEDEKSPYG